LRRTSNWGCHERRCESDRAVGQRAWGSRLNRSGSPIRRSPWRCGILGFMSRAHIDEHAASPEDDVAPLKLPLPPRARNYMTPRGAARLLAELERLRAERRPALAARAAGERAPGPARRDLAECDRRIGYLSSMQALLEVVDPAAQQGDRVLFGATVTVRLSPAGERRFRIVGVDEVAPGSGDVSWISPVARALMGSRVGDTVRVELPAGPARLEVLSIEYGTSG
jgi:transcription elongation factor GreB